MGLFVEKIAPAAKQVDINLAAAVVSKVEELRASSDVTFADVRKALGKTEDKLPDGVIHQALIDAGIVVSQS